MALAVPGVIQSGAIKELRAFAERLEEGLRTGMRDRAEVLDQLIAGHADPVVLDRDRLGLVVGGDVDLKVEFVVEDFLLGELRMAQLFQRVGGVGHELAEENFLLRVERVDDDIEQLLDLGLEFEFLRRGRGHGRE